MRIRPATQAEAQSVLGLIEASMLEIDAETIADLLAETIDGTVLVATAHDEGPILGAIVVQNRRIEAIAVRPKRRGQGVGTALVRAAAERTEDTLVAECDSDVVPFYEQLGFDVESIGGSRYRCRLTEPGTE